MMNVFMCSHFTHHIDVKDLRCQLHMKQHSPHSILDAYKGELHWITVAAQ